MNDQHRIKAQLNDELEQTRTRVAELERVEAALRKSEERYRSLVESTDDSVYLLGRDMRYEFANRKYLSRLGLSLAELIRQEYGKLHPSDASEEVAKKVDQVIKSGEPMVYEHLSHRDDRYFLRTLSPVIGEKPGKIRAITVTSKDITERKRTEEALKQRTYDMRERIKELSCMYGVATSIRKRGTLEEIFRDVAALIPPGWQYPEITRARLRFDKAEYVSEPFEGTVWKLSSDIIVGGEPRGSVEVYYLESRPELDEGPFLKEERQLINGIARALSEAIDHRRAEEKIKRAAQEWRTTFDSISDFVSLHGKDYKVVRANKALADALKMKPGELVGKHCYELVHGTKEPHPDCPFKQVQKTKKPSTVEFFEPSLGMSVQVSISPIINEEGEFTGALKSSNIKISMDGKGRWMDNVIIERLWRSLKYEEVYLKAYETVPEARAGIKEWIRFYNHERTHQSLARQTPEQVYFFKSTKELAA